MHLEQLKARERRWAKLWFGLAAEFDVWGKELLPLTWRERERYRAALTAARRGVEEARAVLAGAASRAEGAAGQAGA